jgi:hypothetical protein
VHLPPAPRLTSLSLPHTHTHTHSSPPLLLLLLLLLQRHSEPSPELYKGAVLALLTDWVEDEYDTFVNGVQAFDSETNVRPPPSRPPLSGGPHGGIGSVAAF